MDNYFTIKQGDFEYIPHRDLKRYQSIFDEKEAELSKAWKKKKRIKYSICIIFISICIWLVWSFYYELDTTGFNILFLSAVAMIDFALLVCELFDDTDEHVIAYLDSGLVFSKKYEDKEIIKIKFNGYGVKYIEYVSQAGNVHKDYTDHSQISIKANIHIDHPILDMNAYCLYLPYERYEQ